MKRIEIPIVDRLDTDKLDTISNNNINKITDLYKRSEISDLWYKYQNHISFTRDDLTTLYDIYNESYLLSKDELQLIIIMRNKRIINSDLAKIFDCDYQEIAFSQEDLKKDPNRYVVLWNRLNISKYDSIYKNLKYIKNGLHSFDSESIANKFPSLLSIGGFVNLTYLEDASGLISLKSIGGDADFDKLTNASGLNNLEIISFNAYFNSLKSINELESLRYIGLGVNFKNLSKEEYTELKRRIKKR